MLFRSNSLFVPHPRNVMASQIPGCTLPLRKLIEKFSRDPILIPVLLGNLAITSYNRRTCSFTFGKISSSLFLLWNRGYREGTFLFLRLFFRWVGFFFFPSSATIPKIFFEPTMESTKRHSAQPARLLENPSHPSKIREAAALISEGV